MTTALKIKWTKSELDYTLPTISLENRDVQVQNQDHNTHFETKEELRDFGSGSILTKKHDTSFYHVKPDTLLLWNQMFQEGMRP